MHTRLRCLRQPCQTYSLTRFVPPDGSSGMVLDLVFCDNTPKVKYALPEPVTRIFKGLDGAWFSSDGISVFSHNYNGGRYGY